MMKQPPSDQYSAKETVQRFEAALRGARAVGHKQMKDISPKRPKMRRRRTASSKQQRAKE